MCLTGEEKYRNQPYEVKNRNSPYRKYREFLNIEVPGIIYFRFSL
jgi:hypothetical protein